MASNGDFFVTAMMRYNEKQIYKKFLKVIDIPPIVREVKFICSIFISSE
jgi:hypothetical protein